MVATFTCTSCGRQGSIKGELPAAAKLRCPRCHTLFSPQPVRELVPVEEVSESPFSWHSHLSSAKILATRSVK